MMRFCLLIVTLICAFSAYAQTWRSVDVKAMNPFVGVYGSSGSLNNRHFRINPYNNDIWLTYSDAVQLLNHNGDYFYYNNSNTPIIPLTADFRDFAFTSQFAFAISENYGLYQFDYTNWNLVVPFDKGINMTYDADTVWCVRTNQNYVKWYGGFNSTGSHSASRKAEIKQGLFWVSGENSGIYRYENNQPKYYSPDTTTLMDWGCWDMKYYPGTDSLFVANDAGFAIADGTTFIDSICATNCTNMPAGIILEFEFDTNNNIWALIGQSNYDKTALAHYNVLSKVWDQYYDVNSSPIDFGGNKVSIEIDTLGNLWVVDNQYLHVLDEGNAPQWVGLKENNVPLAIEVFPNPSENTITLNFEGQDAKLTILDVKGSIVQELTVVSGESISLEALENGVYLFEFSNDNGKTVKRVVKK